MGSLRVLDEQAVVRLRVLRPELRPEEGEVLQERDVVAVQVAHPPSQHEVRVEVDRVTLQDGFPQRVPPLPQVPQPADPEGLPGYPPVQVEGRVVEVSGVK